MKKKLYSFILIALCIGGCGEKETAPNDEKIPTVKKEALATETFILHHLLQEDDRIQTNITDRSNEYLSETIGLWMDYLLMKNDFDQFQRQVQSMEKFFLSKEQLVAWKVDGDTATQVNAFIDDLRIVNALYKGGKQWDYAPFTNLAHKMGKALAHYQKEQTFMVDYVDILSKDRGDMVTLSYIIPEGFEQLKQNRHIRSRTYKSMKTLLVDAPFSSSHLLPKAYDIKTDTYTYDDEVNMIDQFYTGYHRAQWGGDVTPLFQFAKSAFQKGESKLFGRYDHKTKEPTVPYENVSVYALAILFSLEINEIDFAKQLYTRMKTFQQQDDSSPYFGGYIDIHSKSTHSFDNILALLAERKGIDDGIFEN